MNWTLKFLPEAQKDFEQLAGNQKLLVAKALDKVVQNPVSIYEGGYGKPLGSKSGTDLSGLLKIKLRDAGLRIVYKLVRTETSHAGHRDRRPGRRCRLQNRRKACSQARTIKGSAPFSGRAFCLSSLFLRKHEGIMPVCDKQF